MSEILIMFHNKHEICSLVTQLDNDWFINLKWDEVMSARDQLQKQRKPLSSADIGITPHTLTHTHTVLFVLFS